MSHEKQILQLFHDGHSQRSIAVQLSISRNTVAKVLKAAELHPLDSVQLKSMEDVEIHQLLFPEEKFIPVLVVPDFDYIHKELLKSGVTLKLLWDEYVSDCRSANKPPYKYAHYCKLYQDYVNEHHLTMHIQHKPGIKVMVDWAGTKMQIYDRYTGNKTNVYLFVATLPFSMYTYAKACRTMNEEDWINAHIEMYEFFGGVTKLLVPDNLKTGVISHKKTEDPVINKSYQELANHYQTAILPARVLTPKDKAAVEGAVGNLSTHVIAKLRNSRFESLAELNRAIKKALEEFNNKPFQKKDGSRYSVFSEEEKNFLKPLPALKYEFAKWKKATVQLNYHISVDFQNYSVPYEYVKKQVDVRIATSTIEVYFNGNRISSHKRLYSPRGQYSTHIEHMPPNHQLYSEWDKNRFLKWAGSIGEATYSVIQKIFASYRVEEQAYKGCLSILKLADKYGAERLESACKVALEKISNPRYKNIRLILESGNDTIKSSSPKKSVEHDNSHAILRGAEYYGGNSNEK